MKARIITPEGEETEVEPANGQTFTLEEMQRIVGGYVETVIVRDGDRLRRMALNEDGISLRLKPNPKATHLWLRSGGGSTVVGTVLVFNRSQLR